MSTKLDKDKSMSKAKIALLNKKNATFISTIVLSLEFSWDETIPTACTNGLDLCMNPDFWMKQNPLEQIGLLAHEAWHVACQHVRPERRQNRDPNLYNQAADHFINLMLTDNGFHIPKGGLCNPEFRDMSTEAIYDILVKDPSKQSPNFQPDFSTGGGNSGQGQPDPAAQQAHQNKITDLLVRAATQSKLAGDNMAGQGAGEILVALDEVLYPKLPWQVILQDHFNGLAKEDYSMARPNRRFIQAGFYLPALFSEGMGTLACAVDTSGSVSDEDFAAFRTEMAYIKELLSPESMHVVDFDTKVNNIHILQDTDNFESVQFTGRGGTSLYPVFEHYKNHKPEVLVVFSDLECAPIENDPGYPVIWIRTPGNGHTPNFGKLIEFDPHQ